MRQVETAFSLADSENSTDGIFQSFANGSRRKAAVAAEIPGYTDGVPGEGDGRLLGSFDEVPYWFETLAKAERCHAKLSGRHSTVCTTDGGVSSRDEGAAEPAPLFFCPDSCIVFRAPVLGMEQLRKNDEGTS